MNVDIISREFIEGSMFDLSYWVIQVSESDAQIILANPLSLLFETPLGPKYVDADFFASTPEAYRYGVIWKVEQNSSNGNWQILMICLPDGLFFGSVSIDDISSVSIEGDYSLSFVGVKNFVEPIVQEITETFDFDFIIVCSDWLIVSPLLGNGEITLNIVPKPTDEMDIGVYVGFVKVMNEESEEQNIVVNYTLSDFIQSPYLNSDNAFTLDPKYVTFSSTNADTYFQTKAIVRTYDFFTNTLKLFEVPQKVMPFNGVAKINFGRLIHRLMRRFTDVNETELQYRKTEFQLNCEERLLSDNSLVRSITGDTIKFIAGLSKEITDLGFLDFNSKPNRVTPKGFAYLNVLIPEGTYVIKVFKNAEADPIQTIALPESDNKIISKKITFENFVQGDVVRYVLENVVEPLETPPSKTYMVFPQGRYSCMLVWENEFLLQTAIEFTGGYSLKSEFEFLSLKTFETFVEKLDHVYVGKEVKAFINTGWLLKTDIDTIESLMRSKKAWLIKDSKTINVRQIAKSVTNEDSERELIEFNLEFQINRSYDEETYSS